MRKETLPVVVSRHKRIRAIVAAALKINDLYLRILR